MRTQGRGARRLAVLAAASLGLTLAVAGTSSAATTPTPALTGSVSHQSVKVAWKFTTGIDRGQLQLEIDRGPDASHLSMWKTLERPRPAAYRLDRQPLSPTSVYRVRLLVKGVAGAWSNTITVATTNTPPPPPPPGGPCANAKADMVKAVNDLRASNHLAALTEDSRLDAAAQTHDQWMVDTGIFDHGTKTDPGLWYEEIVRAGYPAGAAAQNIAAGQNSLTSVMGAWENSPGHLANMLGNYKNIGIGCLQVSTGYRYYWTQDFAS